MSDEKRRPLMSIGEQISVNTSEVDSIGGAKPEPEERPAFVTTFLDPTTGDLAASTQEGVAALAPTAPRVTKEYTVAELAKMLGKRCGRCRHFNHKLGQALIEEEMQSPDAEVRDQWRNVVAELAIASPALAGEEFVSDPFAPLPAETEILRMGLCHVLSNVDRTFVHPDTECRSEEIVGSELFEPRTKEIALQIETMRDSLFGTANVSWWRAMGKKLGLVK